MFARAWYMTLFTSCVYMFLYIPIVILIAFSFNEGIYSIDWLGFSTKWYGAVFSSPEAITALGNSLIVAFFSVVLSVAFGSCYVFYGPQVGLHKIASFFISLSRFQK